MSENTEDPDDSGIVGRGRKLFVTTFQESDLTRFKSVSEAWNVSITAAMVNV